MHSLCPPLLPTRVPSRLRPEIQIWLALCGYARRTSNLTAPFTALLVDLACMAANTGTSTCRFPAQSYESIGAVGLTTMSWLSSLDGETACPPRWPLCHTVTGLRNCLPTVHHHLYHCCPPNTAAISTLSIFNHLIATPFVCCCVHIWLQML